MDPRATLSNRPSYLRDLWIEYVFEVDNRKPAGSLTPREQGSFKFKEFRRKVFSDRLEVMSHGWDETAPITPLM